MANIEVVTGAAVSALEGRNGVLEAVRWRHGKNGNEMRHPIDHLFLFIGAEPNTDWLAGSGVKLDAKGFVLTGEAAGGDRHALETSHAASSPLAMSAPARSSASPPQSAKARRWWRRCTATWRKQPASRRR
jgi:hypothetical protein